MPPIIKIHLVAGARPNFMKVAPLYHQLKKGNWCEPTIISTGQHYSKELSEVFYKEFSLPNPNFELKVGEGDAAEQLQKIIVAYEQVLSQTNPDLVIVVGDVTSTLAGCLAAKKRDIKVAHVESGLRSRDMTMPEEQNRIAVDAVSDLLFAPSLEAVTNLKDEGLDPNKIFLVGNIMIDTYDLLRPKIQDFIGHTKPYFESKKYSLVTLHRPSNVDEFSRLKEIVDSLLMASEVLPLIFTVHPRTEKKLKQFKLWDQLSSIPSRINLRGPLGYIEFMSLLTQSHCVLTDSGGLQEEATYLNIPCFTLRKNTERPITLTEGSNQLIEPKEVVAILKLSLEQINTIKNFSAKNRPNLWDGRTSSRILIHLKKYFGVN